MNRGRWRPLIGVLLTLFMLASPVGMAAQEGAASDGELPARVAEGETPEHDVIVRSGPNALTSDQTQVVIPPVADAYIASERPNQNFGRSTGLFLGYNLEGDHFGAQRILIRFDLESSLPEGVHITDAELLLSLGFSKPEDDEPMPTRLQRVDSPWEETTVTWNTEPTWGPTYTVEYVDSAPGWYTWEVTDLVRAWYSDTVDNFGMQIIGDEVVQQRERAFHARETSTSHHPRLVVTYTDIEDTEPPIVTVDSLPTYVPREFMVSWTGEDPGPADIRHYDVQVRVDGGEWTRWLSAVTGTEAKFVGEHGRFYEFEARGVDTAGNVEPFEGEAEASTTADTRPPITTVDPLPTIIDTRSFLVSWTGHDDVSGIDTYDVIYRVGAGEWILWLSETEGTSAAFNATADGLYQFEARARDNVGNEEGFDLLPEASVIVDAEPPFIEARVWLPLISNNWGGTP